MTADVFLYIMKQEENTQGVKKKAWSKPDKPIQSPDKKITPQTSLKTVAVAGAEAVKSKKDKGIKEQHKLFALEFIKDGNGKQAAIRAGYAERSAEVQASRLLRNDKVKAYIDKLHVKVQDRALITIDEIVTDLKEIKDRCLQTIEPFTNKKGEHIEVENKEGIPLKAYLFDANGAVKALQELAKLHGFYPPEKKEVKLTSPVSFEGEEKLK